MLEEFLKSLQVKTETWILSLFFTTLITAYRILEPEEPATWKKVLRIIVSGLACTLVVPGLLRYYYYPDEDPFVVSCLTGLTGYCFDPVLKLISKFIVKTASDKLRTND